MKVGDKKTSKEMAVTPDKFTGELKKVLSTKNEIVLYCDKLAEAISSFETKRKAAKGVGTGFNFVSAGLAIAATVLTCQLHLIPIAIGCTLLGSGTNVAATIFDHRKTKEIRKNIEEKLRRFGDRVSNLQNDVRSLVEQRDALMRAQNIDVNRATFLLFGYSDQQAVGAFEAEMAEYTTMLSIVFTFLVDQVMPLLSNVGGNCGFFGSAVSGSASVAMIGADSLGKGIPVTSAIFAALQVADLIKTLNSSHPSVKTIREISEKLNVLEPELDTCLEVLQNVSSAAKNASAARNESAITFLTESLGGGYTVSQNSTLIPVPYLEFVDLIGRDVQGGIFCSIFLAEQLHQTITICDRTTEITLHGPSDAKPNSSDRPSGSLNRPRNPIQIAVTKVDGVFKYCPLYAEGIAVTCTGTSLFDAVASQLQVDPNILIESLQNFFKNDNCWAREVYAAIIRKIFPDFEREAQWQGDATNGQRPVIKRTTEGDKEILTTSIPCGCNEGVSAWHQAVQIIVRDLVDSDDSHRKFTPMQKLVYICELKRFELTIKRDMEQNPTWRSDVAVEMTYDPNSVGPQRPTNVKYEVKRYESNILKSRTEMKFRNKLVRN